MSWTKLDRTQSLQILEHIAIAADPYLFSGNTSEASFKPLSFYQEFMLYRVVNYATLPSFSLDLLSDGESFYLLDGSVAPINLVNAKGQLHLNVSNVIDYVEFYLNNIRGEDGDIYMIRDTDSLPFIESLSLDQQVELRNKNIQPEVMLEKDTENFIILADLLYAGTLVSAGIIVEHTGKIEIKPKEMIMSASRDFKGA